MRCFLGSTDEGITDEIDTQIGVDFSSELGDKPNAAEAMWRIAGTVRAKKMRQDDAAEFISASLGFSFGANIAILKEMKEGITWRHRVF